MMKLFLSIIVISVFSYSSYSQMRKAPSGWRFPTVQDAKGDWKNRRKDGTRPYKTLGDFNNDKIIDEAWILVPTRGIGAGLFVFLGQPDKTLRVIQLDYQEGDSAQNLYLKVAAEGEYDTVCGKRGDCASDQPSKLNLKFQAISYGTIESSEIIFYWDVQRKTFLNAVTGD